jgi:hypothetical protein
MTFQSTNGAVRISPSASAEPAGNTSSKALSKAAQKRAEKAKREIRQRELVAVNAAKAWVGNRLTAFRPSAIRILVWIDWRKAHRQGQSALNEHSSAPQRYARRHH